MTLEREIYSIETANINKETLDAMKNAGSAMKQIHAGLTIDKVDNVMYVFTHSNYHRHLLLPSFSTCIQFEYILTHEQGRSPRTARHWRRNQRSNNQRRNNRRHRRRRARRGARGAPTREARRRHAGNRQRTRKRQDSAGPPTRCASDRGPRQAAESRGGRRGGGIAEAAGRDGYVSVSTELRYKHAYHGYTSARSKADAAACSRLEKIGNRGLCEIEGTLRRMAIAQELGLALSYFTQPSFGCNEACTKSV